MKNEKYEIKKEAIIAMALLYKNYTNQEEGISIYEIDRYVEKLNENLERLDYNFKISTDKITDNVVEKEWYGFSQKTPKSNYIIDNLDNILRAISYCLPDEIINASLIGDYYGNYNSVNNIIGVDTKSLPIKEEYISSTGVYEINSLSLEEAIKSAKKSLESIGGKNIKAAGGGAFQKHEKGWYIYYYCQEPTYLVDITALISKKVNNQDLEQHPAYKYLKRRPYINK